MGGEAAELLGTDYDVLEKTRVSAKEIHIKPRKLDAKGRDVLIIDDIVSTGGTIMEVIKSLKAQGANKITAACTHAVLSDIDTLTGLFRAGMDEFIATTRSTTSLGSWMFPALLLINSKKSYDLWPDNVLAMRRSSRTIALSAH